MQNATRVEIGRGGEGEIAPPAKRGERLAPSTAARHAEAAATPATTSAAPNTAGRLTHAAARAAVETAALTAAKPLPAPLGAAENVAEVCAAQSGVLEIGMGRTVETPAATNAATSWAGRLTKAATGAADPTAASGAAWPLPSQQGAAWPSAGATTVLEGAACTSACTLVSRQQGRQADYSSNHCSSPNCSRGGSWAPISICACSRANSRLYCSSNPRP